MQKIQLNFELNLLCYHCKLPLCPASTESFRDVVTVTGEVVLAFGQLSQVFARS